MNEGSRPQPVVRADAGFVEEDWDGFGKEKGGERKGDTGGGGAGRGSGEGKEERGKAGTVGRGAKQRDAGVRVDHNWLDDDFDT